MKLNADNEVEIVAYDNSWPELFENELHRIQNALGECIKEIHHIGSTSIPGMPAKPAIDMLLVLENIDDIQQIDEKLTKLRYDNLRRQIIPHVSFFTKCYDKNIRFHLHLHERGSPQINRHINFRDYVIHHPNVANEYAALKIQLASQFPNDIFSYVSGKNRFVQEIDAKAKLWGKRKKDYLLPNTGLPAKNWSYDKIIKAIEANTNVQMTHFAQYLKQVELMRVPGFTLVNTGLLDDTFNYVIDADFTIENVSKKITEITEYFNSKNIPFSWWINPHDKPNDLDINLEKHGYQNTENNCAMYFDLDAWDKPIFSIPELKIIRATDEKTLHDFALVLANDKTIFKTYYSWIASILTPEDPIEYYVGYVNDKPVVRGLSCYFGQVAGLHWLSSAFDERKKGYGRAMQEYRLKRAKDLGYHIAVLTASELGCSLYRRIGYKECGYFKEYKQSVEL